MITLPPREQASFSNVSGVDNNKGQVYLNSGIQDLEVFENEEIKRNKRSDAGRRNRRRRNFKSNDQILREQKRGEAQKKDRLNRLADRLRSRGFLSTSSYGNTQKSVTEETSEDIFLKQEVLPEYDEETIESLLKSLSNDSETDNSSEISHSVENSFVEENLEIDADQFRENIWSTLTGSKIKQFLEKYIRTVAQRTPDEQKTTEFIQKIKDLSMLPPEGREFASLKLMDDLYTYALGGDFSLSSEELEGNSQYKEIIEGELKDLLNFVGDIYDALLDLAPEEMQTFFRSVLGAHDYTQETATDPEMQEAVQLAIAEFEKLATDEGEENQSATKYGRNHIVGFKNHDQFRRLIEKLQSLYSSFPQNNSTEQSDSTTAEQASHSVEEGRDITPQQVRENTFGTLTDGKIRKFLKQYTGIHSQGAPEEQEKIAREFIQKIKNASILSPKERETAFSQLITDLSQYGHHEIGDMSLFTDASHTSETLEKELSTLLSLIGDVYSTLLELSPEKIQTLLEALLGNHNYTKDIATDPEVQTAAELVLSELGMLETDEDKENKKTNGGRKDTAIKKKFRQLIEQAKTGALSSSSDEIQQSTVTKLAKGTAKHATLEEKIQTVENNFFKDYVDPLISQSPQWAQTMIKDALSREIKDFSANIMIELVSASKADTATLEKASLRAQSFANDMSMISMECMTTNCSIDEALDTFSEEIAPETNFIGGAGTAQGAKNSPNIDFTKRVLLNIKQLVQRLNHDASRNSEIVAKATDASNTADAKAQQLALENQIQKMRESIAERDRQIAEQKKMNCIERIVTSIISYLSAILDFVMGVVAFIGQQHLQAAALFASGAVTMLAIVANFIIDILPISEEKKAEARAIVDYIDMAVGAAAALLFPLKMGIKALMKLGVQGVKQAFKQIVKEVVKQVIKFFLKLPSNLAKVFKTVIQFIWDGLKGVIRNFKNYIREFIDSFKEVFRKSKNLYKALKKLPAYVRNNIDRLKNWKNSWRNLSKSQKIQKLAKFASEVQVVSQALSGISMSIHKIFAALRDKNLAKKQLELAIAEAMLNLLSEIVKKNIAVMRKIADQFLRTLDLTSNFIKTDTHAMMTIGQNMVAV